VVVSSKISLAINPWRKNQNRFSVQNHSFDLGNEDAE
jgi:hypothetical protein